jgi:hypothetical protein
MGWSGGRFRLTALDRPEHPAEPGEGDVAMDWGYLVGSQVADGVGPFGTATSNNAPGRD